MKMILLFFLLMLPISSVFAQQAAIEMGVTIDIESSILQEQRTLLIHTPRYAGADRFPVLYVLDGEWNFRKTVGIVEHLSASGRIPPMIVVGVTNTRRQGRPARIQDLAPAAHSETLANSAAMFLSFLAEEVIPYVESSYPTQPYRILAGHSLAGLFSVFSLLTNPDAFQAYIAMSPSLGRNNQQQVQHAKSLFARIDTLKKSLFLSVANEGGNTLLGTQAFVAALKHSAPADLDWRFIHYDKEDHVSVFHPAIYDALEVFFEGWTIPEHYLSDDDVSIAERHYRQLSEKLGFQVNVPASIYTTLGYRILAAQDFDYARWTFEQMLATYPESASAYVGLGDVQLMQGDIRQANLHYTKATQIQPTHERATQMQTALNK